MFSSSVRLPLINTLDSDCEDDDFVLHFIAASDANAVMPTNACDASTVTSIVPSHHCPLSLTKLNACQAQHFIEESPVSIVCQSPPAATRSATSWKKSPTPTSTQQLLRAQQIPPIIRCPPNVIVLGSTLPFPQYPAALTSTYPRILCLRVGRLSPALTCS